MRWLSGGAFVHLAVVSSLVMAQSKDLWQDADHADWVDPTDMLNYDLSSSKGKKASQATNQQDSAVIKPLPVDQQDVHNSARVKGDDSPSVEKPSPSTGENKDLLSRCEKSEGIAKELLECNKILEESTPSQTPFLKQFVTFLLQQLGKVYSDPKEASSYRLHVTLAPSQRAMLERFSQSSEGSVQEAHTVLVNMLTGVEVVHAGGMAYRSWQDELWQHAKEYLVPILQLVTAVSAIVFIVQMQIRWRITWTHLVWKLTLMLFVISVPWNWWHLYKLEVARRHAEAFKDVPSDCRPERQTIWQSFSAAFTIQTDKCARYHEKLLVDPMWEVSPTRALAVTFTKFVLEPLEYIGQSLNKLIMASLQNLPVHLVPFVFLFIVFLVILCIILGFGYRIRLFYLFALEPGQRQQQQQQASIQANEDTAQRLQLLQDQVQSLVNTQERVLALTDLNNAQQRMSIQAPSLERSTGQAPSKPKSKDKRLKAASTSQDVENVSSGVERSVLPQKSQSATTFAERRKGVNMAGVNQAIRSAGVQDSSADETDHESLAPGSSSQAQSVLEGLRVSVQELETYPHVPGEAGESSGGNGSKPGLQVLACRPDQLDNDDDSDLEIIQEEPENIEATR